MKLKKLFILTLLFFEQALCMDVNLFIDLPPEMLQTIGSFCNISTIGSWKQSSTEFNKLFNYKNIFPYIIKFENYDKCTNGLMHFADNNQPENFIHLMQNNFGQRIADVNLLGWGTNPLVQDQINAYKGIQGPLSLNYSGDFSTFLRLTDINPNLQMPDTSAPLFWAHQQGLTLTVQRLLANKRISPNTQYRYSTTFLCHLFNTKQITNIELLLNNTKLNPNIQNKEGETFLHYACQYKQLAIVKLLLANEKTNLNVQGEQGYTPLYSACNHKQIEIIKLLLANEKTDPNVQDEQGYTPLYSACWYKQIEIIKLLLSNKKTNPHIHDSNGATILSLMCWKGETEVVQLLLSYKQVNPNAQNKDGDTPLISACIMGRTKIVKILLDINTQHITDVNIKNNYGNTALDWACWRNRTEITQLLLAKNAIHSWKYYAYCLFNNYIPLIPCIEYILDHPYYKNSALNIMTAILILYVVYQQFK